MNPREFTWKLTINPKVGFVSSRFWKNDNGDVVADKGVLRSYQLRSCMRRHLLVETPIRYPKTAKKALFEPCASRRRARSRIQNTSNSIAGYARKPGVAGIFDAVGAI